MSRAVDITQEQAEAILQIQKLNPDINFAAEWMLVCKGYNEDWEEYTEIDPDDLESVAEGAYDHFQLWPIENAPRGRNGGE